jgi:hypothetical protein
VAFDLDIRVSHIVPKDQQRAFPFIHPGDVRDQFQVVLQRNGSNPDRREYPAGHTHCGHSHHLASGEAFVSYRSCAQLFHNTAIGFFFLDYND